jgi:hypothetical protein
VKVALCLGWVYALVKLLLPISLLMWTRWEKGFRRNGHTG